MKQHPSVVSNEVRNLHLVASRSLAALGVTICLASSASAQLGSHNPMPGERATYAITNARIVTVSGADIERGTVVISNGRITAVGANVAVPAGAKTIDATGASVYP